MKTIFVLTICALLFTGLVTAQQAEEQLYSLLQQGKYRELVNKSQQISVAEIANNKYVIKHRVSQKQFKILWCSQILNAQ